ncbi:hypothetical protein [Priestia koreensis]|uniref:hypothetical protein n=1 Tax=Priestia koreensis TaxID=284581 RepID=UPI00203D27EF|nr:hypothetical protein [Priestia koreensis]MCM3002919.1 hypothetical protein [Priestia koreensis]
MINRDSKRKINFIKGYWFKMLNIDIYTYEKFKLNNLNTYFDELIEMVTLIEIEKEITKHKNGLLFFLKELSSYINDNHFFVKLYSKEIRNFKVRVNKIIFSDSKKNVKEELLFLKNFAKSFRDHQTLITDKMFRELSFLVYNNITFDTDVYRIKSLVNDLISELLNVGYTRNILQKEVYISNKYDFFKKKKVHLSLREQFQYKIEKFSEKNRFKDAVVIFRVNNLKTMFPYDLEGILFYNPIRSDLLERKYNQKVLFMEEGLLSIEEKELFNKYNQKNQKLTEDDWTRIKYTDAHCRIKLNNTNINFAAKTARKKIEEVVSTMRYVYNLDHINISTECSVKYGLKNNFPLFKPINTSKYTKGSYKGFDLKDDIKRDKLDSKSFINVILSSDGIEKDWLLKGIRSLHIGEDQEQPLDKFIHYWIALEYLVGLRDGTNIKSSLLNKCSEILTRNYFQIELIRLYNELKNVFYERSNNIAIGTTLIPDDIKELPGLSNFMYSCNLHTIADNLTVFKKYCRDEYLTFRIQELSYNFENMKEREFVLGELERNYRNLLAKLYRIRNKIFHSALVDELELELYCDWLHSILIAICNDLIYRLESNPIVDEYKLWKKKARSKRYSIINYN